MTIAHLADEYGTIATQIKALQARQDEIKKKLLAYKSDVFVGDQYTVTRSVREVSRLDTSAVKDFLGPDLIEKYTTTSSQTHLRVSVSAAALDVAA